MASKRTEPTEWVLEETNVLRMWEEIGPSKPHQSYPEGSKRLQVDGLTIWPHLDQPRRWARFGDTIRRDHDGRYTVTSPTGDPR
jgi:hypothetical protein